MIIAGHYLGWLWLVVDALAVYRLTRLVTIDTILDQPRNAALRRWPVHRARPTASTLLVCGWCLSVWIAFGAVAATVWLPGWWVWVATPLAISAVAGVLTEIA